MSTQVAEQKDWYYQGSNQLSLQWRNHAAVYRAIWDLGQLSRAELAARTGLNPGTITRIVNKMIEEGLVTEIGNVELPLGRPPIQLEINAHAAYVVGVNLNRNSTTAALVDLRGQMSETITFDQLNVLADRQYAIHRVLHSIQLLLEGASISQRRILGIGVGVPGRVQPETGTIYLSDRGEASPDDELLSLSGLISDTFELPTRIDNNANASALAEQYFGAGRHVNSFVFLRCDVGVGGGVVIDRNLHRGRDGGAGEFGHVTVDTTGQPCRCGNIGCLELYASVPGILSRCVTVLSRPAAEINVDMVASAYTAGLGGVRKVIQSVAGYIGRAVINIVNTNAPDLVIIGGGLGELAPIIAELVQQQVCSAIFAPLRDHVQVVGSRLKNAPVQGAATLIIREAIATGMYDSIIGRKLQEQVERKV
ncbi:MAG TPA: ROK family transcriptional regulator [Ktedonobacteraceae bacterium]|jgi:predicted NBD/HSP70 family sugar kinase